MSVDSLPAYVRLEKRALHRVDDAAGVQIACREGSVWLTLDDDYQDYVLEAGETFTTGEHRRALIYALAPARIDLVANQSRKTTMETFSRFHAMPSMKVAR
jgi:hypothetical protein